MDYLNSDDVHKHFFFPITDSGNSIFPVARTENLGVILSSSLSLTPDPRHLTHQYILKTVSSK